MRPANELFGYGIMAVCINIVLMLVKICAGVLGNSYALIADGIESASDIFSSLITWTGFQLSLRPADENHPYGHGKIESLAGMFSGACLLGAAAFIAYQSVQEIRAPHGAPAWFTLPVLLMVVVTKELLSRKILAAGTAVDSSALRGDAWHHRSDALTSAAAAIGIAIAFVGGPGYEMADDWAALAACVIIVINGVLIFRGALHDVLDGNVAPVLHAELLAAALSVPGVSTIEKCRIRKSGIGLFVEVHVHVEPHMTVAQGHAIAHHVKAALMAHKAQIQDVVVHVEPAHVTPIAAPA